MTDGELRFLWWVEMPVSGAPCARPLLGEWELHSEPSSTEPTRRRGEGYLLVLLGVSSIHTQVVRMCTRVSEPALTS